MSINLPTAAFSNVGRVAAPVQTPYGFTAAPASRMAAYVRSTGIQDGDDDFIRNNLVEDLDAALARCRAGRGDTIYVLPGHEETISTADDLPNLVAGTNIVGVGSPGDRPVFTWSAAAATFLLDVAGVSLQNLTFEFAGDPTLTAALTVAAPITVSAAGCSIIGCSGRVSIDGDQLATIPITTTDAADDFAIIDSHFFGATAGEVTTIVRLVGGERFLMDGCTLQGATSSTTVGVLEMNSTAPTQVNVRNSVFINRKALSVHAVTGIASASGVFKDCGFGILDTATLAGLVTPGDLMMFGCKTVNTAGENGADTTPVSA